MNDCGGYLYCMKLNYTRSRSQIQVDFFKIGLILLITCVDANLKIALLSAGLAVKYFPEHIIHL